MTIALRDLRHSYGRLEALAGITVEAVPGRITAVLGPNAAGKSTLLRCIIGAIRPTSGQALIGGSPAHRLRAADLARRVAYVPQRSVVSAAFSVRDVVALGRYALPPSPSRIESALADLDLLDVADRPYPALSVGQQQRATLARAVAQLEPDGHLILDEPTSAMDLRHVRESLAVLRRLGGGGATVLMAMHDLPLAAQCADDCWLLDAGRLAASGPMARVMELPLLEKVFGVPFTWIEREGHPRVLLPEAIRPAL